MDYFPWELIMLILEEKLSEEKWNQIVAHIVRSCSLSEINEVYSEVISDGNLPLIKIFAENGVDAFEKAKPEKNEYSAAPIFSLIGQKNHGVSLDPKEVMDTIHSGWKTYKMNELSSLCKGKYPKLDGSQDHEMMNFLNKAILEDDKKMVDFLLEYSDVEATNPLSEWDALHSAVLTNNEELIEKLLKKGLDPYHEAYMFPSHFQMISFASKYFGGKTSVCERAFHAKDCFELAKLRTPSNYLFLKTTYDKMKEKRKVSKACEASDSSKELIDSKTDPDIAQDPNKLEKVKDQKDQFVEIISGIEESSRPVVSFIKDYGSQVVRVVDCHGATTIYDLTKASDQEKARNLESFSKNDNLLEDLEEFVTNSHDKYYEGL